MTFLTRRHYSALQDRLNRVFRESYNNFESPDEALTTGTFAPPVDVYEDEHHILLKIEASGIDRKDIDVSIQHNTLTVRGQRAYEEDEKEENFQRVERTYGSFTRSFTLPNTVDPEQIGARCDKGVLKISLGKRAEGKSKQIKVNIETDAQSQRDSAETRRP